jgi:hypothetical protein
MSLYTTKTDPVEFYIGPYGRISFPHMIVAGFDPHCYTTPEPPPKQYQPFERLLEELATLLSK